MKDVGVLRVSVAANPSAEEICEDLLTLTNSWIANVHTPSMAEVSTLNSDITRLKAALKSMSQHRDALSRKVDASNARVAVLEEDLESAQQKIAMAEDKIDELHRVVEDLKKTVEALNVELAVMRNSFSPIEVMSFVRAAEQRFIVLLCKDEPAELQYRYLSEIIEDVKSGDAPPSVCASWEKYKDKWDAKLWGRMITYLSDQRGRVCHKEDRDGQTYCSMSEDEVQSLLASSTLQLQAKEIGLVKRIHNLTAATL